MQTSRTQKTSRVFSGAALAATLAGALAFTSVAKAADIIIGVPNWPSVLATAHVLKVAVEENLGLDVELQTSTNPVIFEAMDGGAIHAHPEVWLPNQQALHDKFVNERKTVVMNPNPVIAWQAMGLPKDFAMEHGITSIDDLSNPDIAALFDSDGDGKGEIYIGTSGWASTNIEKIRAKSYGYDQTFTLTEMDETLAYAGLDTAITAGKPWVGYLYGPNYVTVLHDMLILEEPAHDPAQWNVITATDDPAWLEKSEAGVAWDNVHLNLHYAKSLEETHPQVAKMFYNMKLDGDDVSQMTYALSIDKRDAAEYAAEWVAENNDRVVSWLTN